MSKKVVLFIAQTLDGYIAGPNGELDFLKCVEETNVDYGYSDFFNSVDVVILGRKTYEKLLSFKIDDLYPGKKIVVLTKGNMHSQNARITFFSGDIKTLISDLKKSTTQNIYCDGGSETIFQLLQYNLIDEMNISIIPILIGNGIPLFKKSEFSKNLKLLSVNSFSSGLVLIKYEVKKINNIEFTNNN